MTTSTTGGTIAALDSTGSSDATTLGTEDGIPFLIEPDGGGVAIECEILEQDCPPGHKCVPYSSFGGAAWDATHCVPIAEDPNPVGEPCAVVGSTGEDDCDGTSMCWDIDPKTVQGTCTAFCLGPESAISCLDPCTSCAFGASATLYLCLPGCDPLLQDCGPDMGCYALNQGFACVFEVAPDDAGIASSCEQLNGCPPGLACIDDTLVPGCTSDWGCCAPFCPVDGVDPCSELLPGTTCTPWFEDGEGPPLACLSGPVGMCMVP